MLSKRIIKSDKYLNRVKVLWVNRNDEALEEDILMKVKKKEIQGFRCPVGRNDPQLIEGKEFTVELILMTTAREKREYKEKDIKTEQQWGTPNHCTLTGEIKAIYDIDNSVYKCAVVDCKGIFVGVEVAPEDNFKIKNYMKAEGRLDIYYIKEKEGF